MNIEEITSSLKNSDASLYSNISIDVSVEKKEQQKNDKIKKPFFNSEMAEASQYLVFEEIYKADNHILFIELEDRVYDRYDNILKNHNDNFIFSLKMPFQEWIKLQIELGNIIINIHDTNACLSVSGAIEELLKNKMLNLYEVTGEGKNQAVS